MANPSILDHPGMAHHNAYRATNAILRADWAKATARPLPAKILAALRAEFEAAKSASQIKFLNDGAAYRASLAAKGA